MDKRLISAASALTVVVLVMTGRDLLGQLHSDVHQLAVAAAAVCWVLAFTRGRTVALERAFDLGWDACEQIGRANTPPTIVQMPSRHCGADCPDCHAMTSASN